MSGIATPLVSIVTVCKNAEKTLQRAMQSVSLQTYPYIEYIVIDGASIDSTVKMIRACPAVTMWISEPDKGIADAFNKGISLASGEWVGILNADDWYEPDAVAHVVEHAKKADIVHGAVRYWRGENSQEVYYPCQERLRQEMTINHPSVFIRKSVYNAEGGFDLRFHYAMDYELILRYYIKGYRFKEIENTILANMSYDGVSDRFWKQSLREVVQAKLLYLPSPPKTWVYYGWQLVRGYSRRICEKLGLMGFVRFVREHASPMRKI